jgi:NAD-dependent DNA ligase
MLDKDCFDSVDSSINMLVPWYLMSAYAYYVEDDPILSDAAYDNVVKKLLAHWDEVEHHHKHLLTKESLEAGTFLGEYPSIVRGAVHDLRKSMR